MAEELSPWIGVDLDGTLAIYDEWDGPEKIGDPVPEMVARVRNWLAEGTTVKIMTARAVYPTAVRAIKNWCAQHIGRQLEVTNQKDFAMIELWCDRVVTVEKNTGRILTHERQDG